jgi:hypothetical protein
MLQLGALSAAYLIAHPEAAQQMPSAPGGSKDYADILNTMDNNLHYQQNMSKVWSGGCRPPVGCY